LYTPKRDVGEAAGERSCCMNFRTIRNGSIGSPLQSHSNQLGLRLMRNAGDFTRQFWS
jgi:hypothetical protein